MGAPTPVCLKFGGEILELVRSRISYALRVFAAIYNYRVMETAADGEAICIEYGEKPPQESRSTRFYIPARYRPRTCEAAAGQLVKHRYANEDLYLSHGVDLSTGRPDWLGEIFEWLSSSHELGIQPRDSVGRIPYGEMIFSKQGISPSKPYASLLMAWMENALRNGSRAEAFAKAPSPIAGAEHLVVCSHDIDFYHVDRISTLVRLAKNLGIALQNTRNLSFFLSNSNLLARMVRGRRVGDYLPAMLERIRKREFQSTLFVVPRQGHPRDPNYKLRQLLPYLSEVSEKGFSVDLHGSYTSVIEGDTLNAESLALERAIGRKPLGSRQHWLRFDQHEKLFRAVQQTELVFDSTLGFSDMVGFRNGASFAFPPYDFKNEKPYRFLEIPLALMDVNLEAASRALGEDPQALAAEILSESRRWGWGGISVLWHNPMEPLHVPEEINEVFWNCAPEKGETAEKWTSAEQFVTQCLSRYQNAGLLEGVRAGT
jgi:hypothetical protein